MKKINKPIWASLLLIIPTAAFAVLTSVDDLDVGTGAPNTAASSSAAVGSNNHASYTSLAVGVSCYTHEYSFAAGHSNRTKNMSAAIGWQNDVNYHAPGQYPRYAFASGMLNDVVGNGSFATGFNNDISADYSSVLGKGLVVGVNRDYTTVIGTYNVDKDNIRLAVGNGGSSSNRSNAFEVYENGDVIINKEQGDISMGDFGN